MTATKEAVQWILRASAPGHLDTVADSLQRIAPESFMTKHNNSSVLNEIKEEQKKFQCLPQEKQQQDVPSNCHPLAGPLATKLEQYQQQNFAGKQGVTARMTMKCDDEDDNSNKKLVIHTYAEKLDIPNRISGYWQATWTIISNPTNDRAEISGRVQIHSFAYEEGNAQVKVDQHFDTKIVTSSSTSTTAQKKMDDVVSTSLISPIMKQITEWESDVLGLLAALNEGGTGEHLKSIRRVLPITKTKMKWDVVAQRSVKTLKKTAPQAKSKVNYGSEK
jgi:hypothetical protein